MRFERPTREHFMVFFAAILWGSVGVFVRWVDLPGQEMVVVFWRVLIGAAFFLAVIFIKRDFRALHPGKRPWLLLASGALLTFHWVIFFKSINALSLSDAVFIAYLAPVLVALFAPVFLHEKLERNTVYALGLAVAGVALLSLTQKGDGGSSFSAAGLVYAGLSAVSYAGLVLILKVLRESTSTLTITFYQTAVGVALLWPFALFQSYSISGKGWASLAVLGVVHVGITGLIYVYAVRKVKAQHLGIISYIEPVSAIFYGWFLLSETPGWQDLAGGLLIVIAGFIIFLRPNAPPVEVEPGH